MTASTKTSQLDPIQVLWVRGNLSRMEILSIRSFLGNGHPVHLYTYDCPGNVPESVTILDASEIVPECLAPPAQTLPFQIGSYAIFSDYFRYALLDLRGGWWSDLDYICLRPWIFPQPALTASTAELGYGR